MIRATAFEHYVLEDITDPKSPKPKDDVDLCIAEHAKRMLSSDDTPPKPKRKAKANVGPKAQTTQK